MSKTGFFETVSVYKTAWHTLSKMAARRRWPVDAVGINGC